MISAILLLLFYLLCPVLVIYLANRYPVVNKIGPVVICYSLGLILGNIGILPHYDPALQVDDPAGAETKAKLFYTVQDTLNTGMIVLALPLLLFSLDIRSWLKMAGMTFLSLVLGLLSVFITVIAGFYLFINMVPDVWKIGGLLIGVYSGGTPNIAVLRLALDVDPGTYIVTHTYDLIVGAFVLLFLLTVAQRFFLLFMRPFGLSDTDRMETSGDDYVREFESYRGIFSRKTGIPLLGAVGAAILIILVSFGLSKFGLDLTLGENADPARKNMIFMTTMILLITTFGILASLIRTINRIQKSFQAGMYLILVFCVVVASMADIRNFSLASWPILVYVILAVVGSLFIHAFLSKLFRVDVDNFIIISVALSMSPPFVPVVAGALKNKWIIIPGLVVGIIGYAIGNYLGVAVAFLLKALGGG